GQMMRRSVDPLLAGFHIGEEVIGASLADLRNKISPLSQVLFRRSAALDGFNERLYAAADFELWLRVLVHGNYFGMSQPLMNVQHYQSLAVRARVDETMLGLSDLLELK